MQTGAELPGVQHPDRLHKAALDHPACSAAECQKTYAFEISHLHHLLPIVAMERKGYVLHTGLPIGGSSLLSYWQLTTYTAESHAR